MREPEATSIQAELVISGDIDSKVITQAISIIPTTVYEKGSRAQYMGMDFYFQETTWKFKTDVEETRSFKLVIDKLRSNIESKAELILKLKKDYDLDIQISFIVKIVDDLKPASSFEPEFLKFVSFIEAGIDIDMYIYD